MYKPFKNKLQHYIQNTLQDVLQLTSLCFIVLYNLPVRFSFIPELCSITAMLFTANSAFS